MRTLTIALVCVVLIVSIQVAAFAVYGVRMMDLKYRLPHPPNPVKVWGKVTSLSPLKLSDGSAEITVVGLSGLNVGDFTIAVGDWDGNVLTVGVTPPQLEMVSVTAGSFSMGSSGVGDDLTVGRADELPQHSVQLAAFHITKHEITRGEFKQFVSGGGYSNQTYWSTAGWAAKGSSTHPLFWEDEQNWGSPPGKFTQTDNHPVVGVTYYEAEAFCNWVGGHLPTEAQWEKAARWDGHPRIYPWGDSWDEQKCNNWNDFAYPGFQTAAVGSCVNVSSPYGCQDMAGNAGEWCLDYYQGNYYSQTPSGGSWVDPQGPTTGTERVIRGGGWFYDAFYYFRCAFRDHMDPTGAWYDIGFRVVK